jgi:hypothetical protein
MSIENISTKDLMKELILRIGDCDSPTCIEIELGRIMQIAYYPESNFENKFRVSAESHKTREFNNIDDAVDFFFTKLYRR